MPATKSYLGLYFTIVTAEADAPERLKNTPII